MRSLTYVVVPVTGYGDRLRECSAHCSPYPKSNPGLSVMLEIEQKFAHADFAAIERRLAEWEARPGEAHTEADHYFNAPDRDFAHTDEAFRLRRIGEANFLTYKGPKHGGPVKVRTELEIPLRDGTTAA